METYVLPRYGQVAAGSVVDFLPRTQRRRILPRSAQELDQFVEFEVCGDSLADRGILDGYSLICRSNNFEIEDITPDKIVIVRLPGGLAAKSIRREDDGTVTVFGYNKRYPAQNYPAEEIEIVALVVEVRFEP